MKLITERLELKNLNENYSAPVLEYLKKNRLFLQDYEPTRDSEYFTHVYQKQLLKINFELFNQDRVNLWIFKKGKTEVIGKIAFSNIIYGCFQSCYLSYKLDKDEINQGYITEALKESIRYVFKNLDLHRIEANIMPKNKQSIRVVEKLGFVNEGISPKYLKINNNWEDHIHMVLLNKDN